METRANYVLIGGFTILASVFLLLFAGLVYLTKRKIWADVAH